MLPLIARSFRASIPLARPFASGNVMHVFDRALKLRHRERAALGPDARDYDHLRDEVADRLTDRVIDIKRKFPVALGLGAGHGSIRKILKDRGGVEKLIQLDSCGAFFSFKKHRGVFFVAVDWVVL